MYAQNRIVLSCGKTQGHQLLCAACETETKRVCLGCFPTRMVWWPGRPSGVILELRELRNGPSSAASWRRLDKTAYRLLDRPKPIYSWATKYVGYVGYLEVIYTAEVVDYGYFAEFQGYKNIEDQYVCLVAAFVGGRSSDVWTKRTISSWLFAGKQMKSGTCIGAW